MLTIPAIQTVSAPHWRARLLGASASLSLLLWAYFLFSPALSNSWRFDDGPHLEFVTRYSPLEYFFRLNILRLQSWAHLTPWNAFFYELGLPAFGLNPRGHYFHLATVIGITAVSSYWVLRLWLSSTSAWMAGALFLALPSTGAVSNMLMTGHYAYGLLFSWLSLGFFALAVRREKYVYALLAAMFYAMACLSKELYVPLIALLLVIPERNMRARLRLAIPLFAVAAAYTSLRLIVLGGVGGYGLHDKSFDLANLPANTLSIFKSLVGPAEYSLGLLAVFVLLALWGFMRQRKHHNLPLVAMGALVILFPLSWLFSSGIYSPIDARLLYAAGVAVVTYVSWAAQGVPCLLVFGLAASGVFAGSQALNSQKIALAAQPLESEYRFVSAQRPVTLVALWPGSFTSVGYLNALLEARRNLDDMNLPRILASEEDAEQVLKAGGTPIHGWDSACLCVRSLTDVADKRVANYLASISPEFSAALKIKLEVADRGVRKELRWEIVAPPGEASIHLDGYMRQPVPRSGSGSYGLDMTGPRAKHMAMKVMVRTEAGSIAQTPWLLLDTVQSNRVVWPADSTF